MRGKKKRQEDWKKFVPHLQVGDIILTRDTSSIISRSIRKVTGSYWNHVLLVLAVPDTRMLFHNILVIGAELRGIEVHRIQRYTHHFDHVDLGVKRMKGLSEGLKEKILAYAFNQLDIPYDFTRLVGFIEKKVEDFFIPGNRHLRKFLMNKDAFICSSFVQKAFYDAMPPERKYEAIFKNDFDATSSLEDITPADVARSKHLEWVYNPHD
jgi:hypothetical protein